MSSFLSAVSSPGDTVILVTERETTLPERFPELKFHLFPRFDRQLAQKMAGERVLFICNRFELSWFQIMNVKAMMERGSVNSEQLTKLGVVVWSDSPR